MDGTWRRMEYMCQKKQTVSLETTFAFNLQVSYNHQCWSGPCFPTWFRFGVSNINWVPVQSGTGLYGPGYRSLYNTEWIKSRTFRYISGVWNSGPMKTSNNKSSGIFSASTVKVLHISREGRKVFWLWGLNRPFNVTPLLEKKYSKLTQFSKSFDLLYKELFFFLFFFYTSATSKRSRLKLMLHA